MLIVVRLLNLLLTDVPEFSSDRYLLSLIVFLVSSAAAVLVFRIMPRDITPEDTAQISDPVPPLSKRELPVCVSYSVIALCFMIGLMYVVSAFLGGDYTSPYTLSPMYIVSLVIIHPVVEEYLFRHLYYEELRQLTPVFAVVAQATMFALDHDTVGAMFNALFCGIVLGLLVENTGRWYTAAVSHSLINLRSLLYTTVLSASSTARLTADIVIFVLGLAALAVLFASRRAKGEKETVAEGEK